MKTEGESDRGRQRDGDRGRERETKLFLPSNIAEMSM